MYTIVIQYQLKIRMINVNVFISLILSVTSVPLFVLFCLKKKMLIYAPNENYPLRNLKVLEVIKD